VKEDISTLKQAQEALAMSRDQALEASRLKGQLLSRVSHELRTPLGAVLGYAELLSTDAFGSLNDEQKDAAVQIVESADYLNQMVNDLLDEAQIESKSLALKMAFFHLEELIQKARAPIEVLARAKGLDFTVQVAPDLPLRLYGDERRIQQIIMNLAGNAIKFTERGQVSVLFSQPAINQWAIQVSDTGSGIPKEAHEYIFEPFRQVNNSITRENRGTGLGLSITRQLVELMDGEISLESEIGKGSTFIVTLPIIRKEEQTQP
jgi:signal transduction histidine kinase